MTHGLEKVSTGSTYGAISTGQIGTLPIRLPDKQTQKSIADFLDRETAHIDQLIERKERLIALVREREINVVDNKLHQLKNSGCQFWKLRHICCIQRGKFTHRPRNALSFTQGCSFCANRRYCKDGKVHHAA